MSIDGSVTTLYPIVSLSREVLEEIIQREKQTGASFLDPKFFNVDLEKKKKKSNEYQESKNTQAQYKENKIERTMYDKSKYKG